MHGTDMEAMGAMVNMVNTTAMAIMGMAAMVAHTQLATRQANRRRQPTTTAAHRITSM